MIQDHGIIWIKQLRNKTNMESLYVTKKEDDSSLENLTKFNCKLL